MCSTYPLNTVHLDSFERNEQFASITLYFGQIELQLVTAAADSILRLTQVPGPEYKLWLILSWG